MLLAPGLWLCTMPFWALLVTGVVVKFPVRPTACRAALAAASVCPLRLGTVTWGIPVETKTVTVRADRHLTP